MGVAALWLFLLGATGTVGYLIDWRKMLPAERNRAIALSYYTCSPLAWIVLPVTFAVVAHTFADDARHWDDPALARRIALALNVLAIALTTLIVIACWARSVLLLRAISRCSVGKTLVFALCLPLLWLMVLALCWALVAVVGYVSLVILSLT